MPLTLDQAAQYLHVDPSTLGELARTGKLPGAKIGRAWVFFQGDLEAYLRAEIDRQTAERRRGLVSVSLSHLREPARKARPDVFAIPLDRT